MAARGTFSAVGELMRRYSAVACLGVFGASPVGVHCDLGVSGHFPNPLFLSQPALEPVEHGDKRAVCGCIGKSLFRSDCRADFPRTPGGVPGGFPHPSGADPLADPHPKCPRNPW